MPSLKFIRAARRPWYAAVSSQTIRDPRIGGLAKAIILYRADQSDDWELRNEDLQRELKVGREALAEALNELAEAGYLTRTVFPTSQGRCVTERILREESETAPPLRERLPGSNVVPLRAARSSRG